MCTSVPAQAGLLGLEWWSQLGEGTEIEEKQGRRSCLGASSVVAAGRQRVRVGALGHHRPVSFPLLHMLRGCAHRQPGSRRTLTKPNLFSLKARDVFLCCLSALAFYFIFILF